MVTLLAWVGGITIVMLAGIGLIVVISALDLVEQKTRRRW